MTARTGEPLVCIDDDEDDQVLFKEAITQLGLGDHELRFFTNGQAALSYLKITEEKPLVILCDLNLPGMTGMDIRKTIDEDAYLRKKAIPFIFYTTEASSEQVTRAYDSTIQGFFLKSSNFADLKQQFELILNYWKACLHPNKNSEP